MKTVAAFIVLLFLSSQAMSVSAETLRAYYEYKIEVEGNSGVTRTSSNVTFGIPIDHRFGDYLLSLLFESNQEKAEQYALDVTLKLAPRSPNSITSTIVSESFEGWISSQANYSQAEFTIDEGGANISIVLRLSRVD